MKGVLPKMPEATIEVPFYFEAVEKLFELHSVDEDLKAPLLFPCLNVAAGRMLGSFDAKIRNGIDIFHFCYGLIERYLTLRQGWLRLS